jgi:tetratricopeptide (TPR) repeat protein
LDDVAVVSAFEPSQTWLDLRTEGERLRGLGAFQPAEPLLREAVSATELDGVAGALELAASLNALGLLYKDLARYDEASELYQRALGLVSTQRESRAMSRALATLYHNLGGIDHARGRLRSAEALARRGVAIRADIDETEDDLATDLVALAAIVEARGRFDEAESLYREALAILERSEERRELEIAVALASLGALHARCQSFDLALEPLSRAVTIKRCVLDARHPDLALTLNNLAFVRERLDDTATAEALYLEASSICAAALGPQHPRTRACRNNLHRLRERIRAANGSSTPEYPLHLLPRD